MLELNKESVEMKQNDSLTALNNINPIKLYTNTIGDSSLMR